MNILKQDNQLIFKDLKSTSVVLRFTPPYIKLSKYKYKDLDKIGFKKCVTFDILSYEK